MALMYKEIVDDNEIEYGIDYNRFQNCTPCKYVGFIHRSVFVFNWF
jgi:hypothetical protein